MSALAPLARSFAVTTVGLLVAASAFASAPPPPAGSYKIDPAHSGAFFEVGHLGGVSRFMGRFRDMSGDLVVEGEKSRARIDIKTDSVDSNHEGLDKHLKSPDFFSAVQFPVMSFASTAVTLNPAGEGTLAGNLTMRGVTKPVVFKLKHVGTGKGMRGEQRVGFVATGTIKRTDFGVNFGVPGAATDEVDLRINVEAVKQ